MASDVEGLLANWTEDCVGLIPGLEPVRGREAMRALRRQPDGSWRFHRSIFNEAPAGAGDEQPAEQPLSPLPGEQGGRNPPGRSA
jgi:ketosteroid isomerase-like protein